VVCLVAKECVRRPRGERPVYVPRRPRKRERIQLLPEGRKEYLRLTVRRHAMPQQRACYEASGADLLEAVGVQNADGTRVTAGQVLEWAAAQGGVPPRPEDVGFRDVAHALNTMLVEAGAPVRCRVRELRDVGALKRHLREGGMPVLVQVQPEPGAPFHTVTVVGYDSDRIVYHEPARGGRAYTSVQASLFTRQWNASGRLALVCGR
jgi:hypothetical protein